MRSHLLLFITIIVLISAKKRLTNKRDYAPKSHGNKLHLHNDRPMTKAKYKSYLNKELACTGAYCNDGKWSCKSGNSQDCYNVDHIIDFNGPEFKNYQGCKNVPGNYVMTRGATNQMFGSIAAKSYDANMRLKTELYGEELINEARSSIRECIGSYYKRDVQYDVTGIYNESDIIIKGDDMWYVIPQFANISCTGCNDTYCEECTCDICFPIYPMFDDDEYTAIIILAVMLGITAIIGFAMGALIVLITTRSRRKQLPVKNIELNSSLLK